MPGPYGTHPPRPSILSTWTDNLRASDTIRRRWNTIAYSDGGDGAARENKKVEPDGKVAARKSGEIFRVGREDGHEDGVCRQIAVRKGRKRNEKEKSKLDNTGRRRVGLCARVGGSAGISSERLPFDSAGVTRAAEFRSGLYLVLSSSFPLWRCSNALDCRGAKSMLGLGESGYQGSIDRNDRTLRVGRARSVED